MATVHDEPTSPWVVFGVAAAALVSVVVVAFLGAAHVTSLVLHGHPATGVSAEQLPLLVRSGGNPTSAWGESSGVTSPALFWIVTAVLVAAAAVAARRAWVWWQPRRDRSRFRSLPGMGSRRRALGEVGGRALVKRGHYLLPETKVTKPEQLGQAVGWLGSRQVYASVEDSGLIIGPPRCGKGVSLVIPMVLDAPGSVVVTATRPETTAVTMRSRQSGGRPVAIFDPQQLTGLPPNLRWSLVHGCQDPTRAKVRALGLAESTSVGKGSGNEGHWKAETAGVCAVLLHAAAIADKTPADLYRWSTGPGPAGEALQVLDQSTDSQLGWADALRTILEGDPKYRDNAWAGVRQALAPLNTPAVADLVSPTAADRLDPVAFVAERGTLYVLGTASGSGPAKPLISAMLNDIAETNRIHAATSMPAGRLNPPLLMMLDEIVQLAKLPDLPGLLADGGGSGISTWVVVQSLAQLETTWGAAEKQQIMDTASWWLVFGGLKSREDVGLIAELGGHRRIQRTSTTHNSSSFFTSSQSSSHDVVPVLDPATVRGIPQGQALASIRNTGIHALDLGDWRTRRDSKALQLDRTELYATIQSAAATQPDSAPAHDWVLDLSETREHDAAAT